MTTYGIISPHKTSLFVVATDLTKALNKLGQPAKHFKRQIFWFDAIKEFDKAIMVMTFDPLYVGTWLLQLKDFQKHGIASQCYATVEGMPKEHLIREWEREDIIYVANSNFTRKMLEAVGLQIIKVIPHGLNYEDIEYAKTMRKDLHQKLKARFVVGTVQSGHPRKGLEYLARVAQITREKNPDIKFYVLTEPKGARWFEGLDNVFVDNRFMKLPRVEVLSLIGSFDVYLQTSLCEGFGLPLLEAQAQGVPCIYPEYEPLTEITPKTLNFPVPVISTEMKDFGDGIWYLCHYYDTEEMSRTILYTFDIYRKSRGNFNGLKEKLKDHAKQYEMTNTYKLFLH